MARKIFRDLLSLEEAGRKLREHFEPKPVGVETVKLTEALGRVTAEDVEAPLDIPPFDRAAMDGYAVKAEDTYNAEEDKAVRLKIVGRLQAGEEPPFTLQKGEAVEIATGAPLPPGANAVVMVEYTSSAGDSLEVYRPVTTGENIMAAGSDMMAGELVLRKSTVLTPVEIGVLAALGISEVKCYRKPVVAVVSTGNEITPIGQPLPYGKIYDINNYTLSASVLECGCEPRFLGVVGDEAQALKKRIQLALETSDVVLVSGGTSAGAGDILYRILDSLGKPGILVHGVLVKPGKPTIIALIQGKPIFGLPGYPTSALMIFNILVQPVLRQMAGLSPWVEGKVLEAKAGERIFSTPGRRNFLPVHIIQAGEAFIVFPTVGGSGAISTLAEADGFIEIPEGRVFLEEGESVQVRIFGSQFKPADLVIGGSHCLGLDVAAELFLQQNPSFKLKIINLGSSGGLSALRRGEVDMAGIHLLNGETGDYNVSFMKKFGLEGKAALVRGYIRRQGLVVARRNPKGIRSLEDLWREDVTLVNRNTGSGTRILLDFYIKEVAKKKRVDFEDLIRKIKGYTFEVKSHSALATAILHGKADVGLAIETVARLNGLDYVHLKDENYDFAIRLDRLNKPAVQAFLKILSSKEFQEMLTARRPGLKVGEETGKRIF
ncbi:molybdopterin biosynthesis protein [Candidatus Hecatella orcuttiae]|jgi:putative molybdopterin biosynthesis protein|uniref:molybdopterin biosynthesis protein n=1 Tax=Candidatus Hecatella orcuttiae TaxID=1935119 RepID=UPI0028683512|nr:molybdopterin biosynthesis protein [Candidatus Hecatella orcuttiae]